MISTTGFSSVSIKKVTVNAHTSLVIDNNTIAPDLGESASVTVSLPATERIQLQIENSAGKLIRIIEPWSMKESGEHTAVWDGRNGNNEIVKTGAYFAVLMFGEEGSEAKLDMSLTGSLKPIKPARTLFERNFAPFNNDPAKTTFTLERPSEVTVFVGPINVNLRLRTFYSRTPMGAGEHALTWNSELQNGQYVTTAEYGNNLFRFGVWAYELPINTIFVNATPEIANLSVTPSIVSPLGNTSENAHRSEIVFELSEGANVDMVIHDAALGGEVYRKSYGIQDAGLVTLNWDAKVSGGHYIGAGRYRIGIRATDEEGNQSGFIYAMQRVYY